MSSGASTSFIATRGLAEEDRIDTTLDTTLRGQNRFLLTERKERCRNLDTSQEMYWLIHIDSDITGRQTDSAKICRSPFCPAFHKDERLGDVNYLQNAPGISSAGESRPSSAVPRQKTRAE